MASTILRLLLFGLLGLLLGAAPVHADDGDDAEKFINELYDVEFRVRVNESIDRGVQWLLRSQDDSGGFSALKYHRTYPVGTTALATLTLLKCGVKPGHEAVQKAFAYMKQHPTNRTYSVSLLLMALDAKYAAARDPFDIDDVDRYGNAKEKDPCAKLISNADRQWMRDLAALLVDHRNADGVWRYAEGADFDLSNTQYALLGLHAASRCGVRVKTGVWLDALRYVIAIQPKTGEPVEYMANEVRGRYRFEWLERAMSRGFPYIRGNQHTLSMTTAGLTALICCQNRLWKSRAFTGALRVESRRSIRDALAWVQQHFTVEHNAGGNDRWQYYYLYGLERCGILGRFRYVGTRDWYREGAEHLMGNQAKSGLFRSGHLRDDTCFALLFLKRATSRMDAPVITPSGGGGNDPALQPEARPDGERPSTQAPKERLLALGYWVKKLRGSNPQLAFRATIRLAAMNDRQAFAPLIEALRNEDTYVRVGAAVALGDLHACDAVGPLAEKGLFDDEDLVRHASHQALVRITGHRGLRYLSSMSLNDRMRLKKQWLAWWSKNETVVRNRYGQ